MRPGSAAWRETHPDAPTAAEAAQDAPTLEQLYAIPHNDPMLTDIRERGQRYAQQAAAMHRRARRNHAPQPSKPKP